MCYFLALLPPCACMTHLPFPLVIKCALCKKKKTKIHYILNELTLFFIYISYLHLDTMLCNFRLIKERKIYYVHLHGDV